MCTSRDLKQFCELDMNPVENPWDVEEQEIVNMNVQQLRKKLKFQNRASCVHQPLFSNIQ